MFTRRPSCLAESALYFAIAVDAVQVELSSRHWVTVSSRDFQMSRERYARSENSKSGG